MTANRLALETSPYLLQHANNPVDWYPWGEEALQKARVEDKPILISIGYAACHWCHVMERESFEDPDTAELMNRDFVNIKIDREERPDLDQIYMDALQAVQGNGGWPLNMFLTPEAKPFYGGTYFPPVRAHGRSSWREVLQGIALAFRERRGEVEEQAARLFRHLKEGDGFLRSVELPETSDHPFDRGDAAVVASNLLKTADRVHGGFGRAPKFPQTFSIRYLLRHHRLFGGADSLEHACLCLDRMVQGGIYDQLGGGFARYSTDAEWLVPHFEKMTYDNALLVSVLSEAYQLTRRETYAEAIKDTLAFMTSEMMAPEGGFYSALDADSEGVEGRFYTWSMKDVQDVLGEDAHLFCKAYGISESGNWEGVNILHLPRPVAELAAEEGLQAGEMKRRLEASRKTLLGVRGARKRPLLDDKILLGWNALMVTALCKAGAALREPGYMDLAARCMTFLKETLYDPVSREWRHSYKAGKARFPAFLDDLAFLVDGLIHLQECTGDPAWLAEAGDVMEFAVSRYGSSEGSLFHFTDVAQTDVILRKTDTYDGATPSGNSMMAWNLYRLSFLLGLGDWRSKAEDMFGSVKELVLMHPASFGHWANLGLEWAGGTWEIALVGNDAKRGSVDFLGLYIPNRVFQWSVKPREDQPLLGGRWLDGMTRWHVCRNGNCHLPLESLKELAGLVGLRESGGGG